MGYVPKIVKELYAALSGETTRTSSERVEVTIRGQEFEFSPARINEYLNLDPLTEYEIEADETIDALSNEELIDFLTEGTLSLKNLTTRPQYPCKAAFVILLAYNWVPLSHKNAVSADRIVSSTKYFVGFELMWERWSTHKFWILEFIRRKEARKIWGDWSFLEPSMTSFRVNICCRESWGKNLCMGSHTRRILVLVKSISRSRRKT